MSTEHIKGMHVNKKGEVWLNSADGSITPLHYSKYKSVYFTELLAEKGREALDRVILREYIGGGARAVVKNKYTRAIRLSYINTPERLPIKERVDIAYEAMINYPKRKKGTFVLQDKKYKCYVKSRLRTTWDLKSAKRFASAEDCRLYNNSSSLEVIELKTEGE